MDAQFCLDRGLLENTFRHFRECGCRRDECQVLWLGPWSQPNLITKVVHPKHAAHFGGFVLDDDWLTDFWLELGASEMEVRVQVHTHPAAAFHSRTDDQFPIIHTPGFLSLVIPNFGLGPVGFQKAYLAEIQTDGRWMEIPINSRFVLT